MESNFKKLVEKAKNAGIGHCRSVAKKILENKNLQDGDIVYVASTPQRKYGGYEPNTTRAYIWKDNDFVLLFSNTSAHRAKIAIKNYDSYRSGRINILIWENYITNGYNTRRGLFRSSQNLSRIQSLSISHADYLGSEINSTTDHENRVFSRN